MTEIDDVKLWLHDHLADLAMAADVPGTAVAIRQDDRAVAAYAGRRGPDGSAVNENSIFEIGSITKVWTATLIMQLVEEDLLSLDTPVEDVLPGVLTRSDRGTTAITVRHLLTHTGGFDGDLFVDTGEDEESLASYVDLTRSIVPFAAPDAVFSYCNAGICILGRIIEVLRQAPFDQVLTDRLIGPLGLEATFPDPHLAPIENVVVGHAVPGGAPVPVAAMARGMAPTGTRLSMTVTDLCAFGYFHATGADPDHQPQVLGAPAVTAMQRPQGVAVPDLGAKWGSDRGLGWQIHSDSSARVLGHTGHTLGQVAALRVVPAHRLALAVVTNGGNAYRLIDDLVEHVQAALIGGLPASRTAPPESHAMIDLNPYLGTYRGRMAEWRVTPGRDGDLVVEAFDVGAPDPISIVHLRHLRGHSFISLEHDCGMHPVYAFLIGRDGRAEFLHNGRAYPRSENAERAAHRSDP